MTRKPAKIKTIRPQHKLFADEWLACQNGSKSAIAAGYSKKTARQKAVDLLKHPLIGQYIKEQSAKRSMRLKVTADRVLEEISRMAFGDKTKILEKIKANLDDGLDIFDGLSSDERACIEGIKPTDYGTEVKFHSKEKAIEMLAKHLKLFSDSADFNVVFQQMGNVKLEHTGANGETETLEFDIGLPPDEQI